MRKKFLSLLFFLLLLLGLPMVTWLVPSPESAGDPASGSPEAAPSSAVSSQ